MLGKSLGKKVLMYITYGTQVSHTYMIKYCNFIEIVKPWIKSNLRRKKLHGTNKGSNFLGCSFSSRDKLRVPMQFRRESQAKHLKR